MIIHSSNLPAVVLSWDPNRIYVEHMIRRYAREWPDHPLEFHVPYQNKDRPVQGARCQMVQTPPGIVDTVLTLIEGFTDETWVYWCIDDKYPLWLDVPFINRLARTIITHSAPGLDGVLFCRAGSDRADNRHATRLGAIPSHLECAGLGTLLLRPDWSRIWIHQFIRVGMLRALFAGMPRDLVRAKDMDDAKKRIPLPQGAVLALTRGSHAVFGESASRGIVTADCVAAMRELGLDPPASTAAPAWGKKLGVPVHPSNPLHWISPRFLRAHRAGYTKR
ncbi:MAG: hypothetical protein RL434_2750 [Pseudomonadota bacterium]